MTITKDIKMENYISVFKVGFQLVGVAKYHKDGRIMNSSFKVLKETPKRYQVEIISELPNGNDWTKPFVKHVEKKFISFNQLLVLQREFCKYADKVVCCKIKK